MNKAEVGMVILEYAAKFQYRKVFSVLYEDSKRTPLPIGFDYLILMHETVSLGKVQWFDQAVFILDSAWQHLLAGDQFKTFSKLILGMKMKMLLQLLLDEDDSALAKLNENVPRHGFSYPTKDKESLARMNTRAKDFRRFYIPLILDEEARCRYFEQDYEQEFGNAYMEHLQRLMKSFLTAVMSRQSPCNLEVLFSKVNDLPACVASFPALQMLVSFIRDREKLDEDSLMELLKHLYDQDQLTETAKTRMEKFVSKRDQINMEMQSNTAMQEGNIQEIFDLSLCKTEDKEHIQPFSVKPASKNLRNNAEPLSILKNLESSEFNCKEKKSRRCRAKVANNSEAKFWTLAECDVNSVRSFEMSADCVSNLEENMNSNCDLDRNVKSVSDIERCVNSVSHIGRHVNSVNNKEGNVNNVSSLEMNVEKFYSKNVAMAGSNRTTLGFERPTRINYMNMIRERSATIKTKKKERKKTTRCKDTKIIWKEGDEENKYIHSPDKNSGSDPDNTHYNLRMLNLNDSKRRRITSIQRRLSQRYKTGERLSIHPGVGKVTRCRKLRSSTGCSRVGRNGIDHDTRTEAPLERESTNKRTRVKIDEDKIKNMRNTVDAAKRTGNAPVDALDRMKRVKSNIGRNQKAKLIYRFTENLQIADSCQSWIGGDTESNLSTPCNRNVVASGGKRVEIMSTGHLSSKLFQDLTDNPTESGTLDFEEGNFPDKSFSQEGSVKKVTGWMNNNAIYLGVEKGNKERGPNRSRNRTACQNSETQSSLRHEASCNTDSRHIISGKKKRHSSTNIKRTSKKGTCSNEQHKKKSNDTKVPGSMPTSQKRIMEQVYMYTKSAPINTAVFQEINDKEAHSGIKGRIPVTIAPSILQVGLSSEIKCENIKMRSAKRKARDIIRHTYTNNRKALKTTMRLRQKVVRKTGITERAQGTDLEGDTYSTQVDETEDENCSEIIPVVRNSKQDMETMSKRKLGVYRSATDMCSTGGEMDIQETSNEQEMISSTKGKDAESFQRLHLGQESIDEIHQIEDQPVANNKYGSERKFKISYLFQLDTYLNDCRKMIGDHINRDEGFDTGSIVPPSEQSAEPADIELQMLDENLEFEDNKITEIIPDIGKFQQPDRST